MLVLCFRPLSYLWDMVYINTYNLKEKGLNLALGFRESVHDYLAPRPHYHG